MRRITRLSQSVSMPRRLLFLDVATKPKSQDDAERETEHALRLGCVSKWLWVGDDRKEVKRRRDRLEIGGYHLSDRRSFTDVKSFYELLKAWTSKYKQTWLFCHNAALAAQVSGLMDAIKDRRVTLEKRQKDTPEDPDEFFWSENMGALFIISDPPTIMGLKVAGAGRLILLDSRNYFRATLEKIGGAVGLSPLSIPHDTSSIKHWESYCTRNVEILELAIINLIDWLESESLGSLKYTAAAQSLQAYRTKYAPEVVWQHDLETVRQIEREAYYGGELRAFRIGEVKEPVWQVDVNSLYPAVMFAGKYPVDWLGWSGSSDWLPGFPNRPPGAMIAEVWIRSFHEPYPRKMDNQTFHCRGSFPTVLAGQELELAVKSGHVIGHRRFTQYKLSDCFAEWACDLYLKRLQAREDEDWLREAFCKMMLTSLHGKFGQLGTDLIPRTDFKAPVAFGMWRTYSVSTKKQREFLCIDHDPFEIVDRKEIKSSNPALSAFITAAARCRMREIRKIAGESNCCYQAVDSLIVTLRGFQRLQQANMLDPISLGKMKIETTAPSCQINGYHDYEIGDKRVLTGRKPNSIPVSANTYAQNYFECAKNLLFSAPRTTIVEKTAHVNLPDRRPKGDLDRLGRLRPLLMQEPLPYNLGTGLKNLTSINNLLCDEANSSREIVAAVFD